MLCLQMELYRQNEDWLHVRENPTEDKYLCQTRKILRSNLPMDFEHDNIELNQIHSLVHPTSKQNETINILTSQKS